MINTAKMLNIYMISKDFVLFYRLQNSLNDNQSNYSFHCVVSFWAFWLAEKNLNIIMSARFLRAMWYFLDVSKFRNLEPKFERRKTQNFDRSLHCTWNYRKFFLNHRYFYFARTQSNNRMSNPKSGYKRGFSSKFESYFVYTSNVKQITSNQNVWTWQRRQS